MKKYSLYDADANHIGFVEAQNTDAALRANHRAVIATDYIDGVFSVEVFDGGIKVEDSAGGIWYIDDDNFAAEVAYSDAAKLWALRLVIHTPEIGTWRN